MSRLRRLKEEKRKNRIKATSCGLVLSLAIGASQGLGTYALFTDSEELPHEISLSTGDVDVEVSDGMNVSDVQPEQVISIPFEITNLGTLNQNIKLELTSSGKLSQYLELFSIIFADENIKIIDGVIYKNNNIFILKPGEKIEGSISVNIKGMSIEDQNKIVGLDANVNLGVKSSQINKGNTIVENGFYDIAIQSSTITMGEANVIPGGSIKVAANNTRIEIEHITNDSNGWIGLDRVIEDYKKVTSIEYKGGNGAFSNSKGTSSNSTYDLTKINWAYMTKSFDMTNTVTLKFNYNDGSYRVYIVDFKEVIGYGNRNVAAQFWLDSFGMKDVQEEQQEGNLDKDQDIEEPTQSETEEPQNPDIEITSHPDIIIPPEEDEIIQE